MPLHQSRHRRSRSEEHLFVPGWVKHRAVELVCPPPHQAKWDTWSAIPFNCFLATSSPRVPETAVLVQARLKRVFSLLPLILYFCPLLVSTNYHLHGPTFCFCVHPVQQWWFNCVGHNLLCDSILAICSSQGLQSRLSIVGLCFFRSSHFSPYQATGRPNVWTVSNPPLLIFLFYWLIYLFSCSTEKWLYSSYFSPCPGFREKELMHPRFWLLACVSLFFFFIFFISMSPFSFLGILRATPTFSVQVERMHHSNSPFAVLLCAQVSRPTDQWGRCRCKWISSLTLALESTKSVWKVRHLSAAGLSTTWPFLQKKKLRRINKNFKLLRIIMISSGWLSHSSLKHLIAGVITLYS